MCMLRTVRRLCQNPSKGDLTGCSIILVCDALEVIYELEVLGEVLCGETREESSKVALLEIGWRAEPTIVVM